MSMTYNPNPPKKHKWHKEIKAWADGAEIEIKYTSGAGSKSGWMTESNPSWDFDECEYRIKPQPKEPQYLYVYMGNFATYHVFREKKVEIADATYIGKIKLEQDDE